MNRKALPVTFMAAFFFGSPHALAQEDPRALAERLYELGRVEATFAATMEAFDASFKESFDAEMKSENPDISDDDLEALHQIIDEESALATEELKAPMKDLLVSFYEENFSSGELQELIDMQSSDLYQKQLDLMPRIMQKTADMTTSQLVAVQDRLTQRLRQWMAENR